MLPKPLGESMLHAIEAEIERLAEVERSVCASDHLHRRATHLHIFKMKIWVVMHTS